MIPFFAFPPEIPKAIYITNAIESVNMTLRKVLKNYRAFPTDESALKVVYLAIQKISKKSPKNGRCRLKIASPL
jgi:putative transposase